MTFISSLYVHVPFCRHLCNYCDFYKRKLEPQSNQLKDYEDYVRASWERHESILSMKGMKWAPFETIYFGGGTPSLWGKRGAEFFSSLILKNNSLATKAEITFEVDPGAWTEETLLAWEKVGVNRFSVGTQSLNPEFIKILDRSHDKAQTLQLLERLKDKNFSVDFLLGVPHSTNRKRNILQELEELLSFGPSHVSLYILNPAAGYTLKQYIPDDEWVGREYLEVSEYLRSRGFNHYEVSNFALPDFESKHNIRYWKGESVAALGPTGTGYFALNPTQAFRYKWKPSASEIEPEELGEKELGLEKLYLRLRLAEPFLASELIPSQADKFDEILGRWSDLGHAVKVGNKWCMTPSGWVVLDSLINEIFSAIPSL